MHAARVLSLATTCPHALQKTCSVSQSKAKVLKINLQSFPVHLGTFWHHSTNTWKEARSATRTGILSFAVLKIIMNNRKSIKEFKTYWTYSWGNFPGKMSPMCFVKENISSQVSCSTWHPFKSSSVVYSTHHRKQWLTFSHSAGENCVISFVTITTAVQALLLIYLGRGFFKFFSFSACFLKFKL